MVDYKALWNQLKDWLRDEIEEHKDGQMMSMSESGWGAKIFADVLRHIEKLEKNFHDF